MTVKKVFYIPKKELSKKVEEEGLAKLEIVDFLPYYNILKVSIEGLENYGLTSGFVGYDMYFKYKDLTPELVLS